MDFQTTVLDNVINDDEPFGSGGGGKSGGAAGGGTESPNTLRSKAIARFLFLLGEGEIIGLKNGAKSIIINKVPYENNDGTTNFKGLTWALQTGTPDQTALPGFENVTSEHNVNLRVRADAPVVYRTTSADLDAIVVTVMLPQLTKLDGEQGALRGYHVEYAIDLRNISNEANAWVTKVASERITGKCTSPYERSYRLDVEGPGPWLVRMRRISPDHDDDSKISDQTFLSHVTEISDYKVAYADSAVLGAELDVEQLGQSADLRFDVQGKKINYPSNYDPVTRTYTGFWNGTFVFGFCNDPAWVLMDVCLNPRYGIGMPQALIDKWGLYQLSQFCSQSVSDGLGGTEPRFTFNGTFYNQEDAYKTIQAIASMMRAIVFYGAGALLVRHDAPSSPEQRVYTPANVVGDFNYSATAKSVRRNACIVQWTNPDIGYEADYEVYEDRDAIIKYGYNPISIKAVGTTSRGQAYRQAKWLVLTEQLQTDTITFEAGLDSQSVLPGDIIEVSDPHWATADFGGRVVQDGSANGTTQVKLDRPIEFAGATAPQLHLTLLSGPVDTVANVDNTGRPIEREIRYFSSNVTAYDPATNIVTLQTAIPDAGNDDVTPLVWIFSKEQQAPRAYKVISNEENTEDGTFTITALQYDPDKYVRMDEGFRIDYDPGENYSNLPTTSYCAPPARLRVEQSMLNGRRRLNMSWDPSPDQFLSGYLVSYKVGDENWVELPRQTHNHLDIDAQIGSYVVSVRAVNRFGTPSAEIRQGLSVTENDPAGQTGVIAVFTDRGDNTFTDRNIRLYWTSQPLSAKAKTSALRAELDKPTMTVTTNAEGQTEVQGGVGSASTGTIASSIADPAAPTITLGGAFKRGDTVRAIIGQSIFSYTATADTTADAMASQLATLINVDPRFDASAATGVVTITFANSATNANTLAANDDPLFRRFRVRVLDPDTDVQQRIEYPTLPEFTYTFATNQQDFGSARRSVKFAISVEDINGGISAETFITMTNPAPAAVPLTVDAVPGVVTMRYTPPDDPDFAGMVVYMSTVSGFVADASNRVFKDRGNPAIPVTNGTTYYYKYAFFDQFGDAGVALSTEQTIAVPNATATIDAPDMVAPGWGATPLSSATVTDPVTGAPLTTLTIDWTEGGNVPADVSQYEVEIRETTTGNWIGGFTVAGDTTVLRIPRVRPNVYHQARVRAFNAAGEAGPFSTIAPADPGHLTAKDTTAPTAPTNLVATASFQNVFLTWTAPNLAGDEDVTQMEVWEGTINNVADAGTVRVATVNASKGAPGSFTRSGLTTGVTRYYWIRAVDTSGNVGPYNAAATAGVAATTASVPSTDVSGVLAASHFPTDLRPLEVVGVLPTTGNFEGRQVFLTTNGKIYRYSGGAFTSAVDGADIAANSITAGAIAAGSISAGHIAANAILASKLLIGDPTNLVPDSRLADTEAWEIVGGVGAFSKVAVASHTSDYYFNVNENAAIVKLSSDPIQVIGNKVYRASSRIWVQTGGAAEGEVTIDWYSDSTAATLISSSSLGRYSTAATTVYAVDFTAPATAVSCRFNFIRHPLGTNTAKARFSDPSLRLLAQGELIVDGTITADKIAANAVTAEKIAANAVIAEKILAGAITADHIAAGTITGDKISTSTSLPGTITVGTTGVTITTAMDGSRNANLGTVNANPNFTAIASDGRPANWYAAQSSISPAVVSYLAGSDRKVAQLGSDTDSTIGMANQAFRVEAGTVYKIVIRCYGTSANANGLYIRICELDAELLVGENFLASNGETGVRGYTRVLTTFGENIAIPATVTTFEYSYTPTATAKWASLLIQNHAPTTVKLNVEAANVINVATVGAPSGSYVGGVLAENVAGWANTGNTTQIDPGKVLISGSTTLANWRNGANNTLIEGGSIAANTISANKVNIGIRGINIEGIEFEANRTSTSDAYVANRFRWSAGTISYINDAGTAVTAAIPASYSATWASGVLYAYWEYGTTAIAVTASLATATAANRIILATYRGGTDLVVNFGRTVIDGSKITTDTIEANRVKAGTIFTQDLYVGGTRFGLRGAIGGAGKGALVITSADGQTGVELVRLGWVDSTNVGFRCKNLAGNVIIDHTYNPIESGADVTSLVTGSALITVDTDHAGVALAEQLPAESKYELNRNGVLVTNSATWSVTVVSGTISCSIATNGNLTITTFGTDEAVLKITAVYSGTTRVMNVTVRKNKAPPPESSDGTTVNYTISYSMTSTAFVVLTGADLTVTVGSTGSVALTASNIKFQPTGSTNGSWTVEMKWEWWNGSSWVIVGSLQSGSTSIQSTQEDTNPPTTITTRTSAFLTSNTSKASLTVGSTQKFRLVGRSTVSKTHTVTGSVTVDG